MDHGGEKKKPQEGPHAAKHIPPGKLRQPQGEEEKPPKETESREAPDHKGRDHQQEQREKLRPWIQPMEKGISRQILSEGDILQKFHPRYSAARISAI
jgi:hypothetical protein